MKIDGKAIAENIFTDLKKRVVRLKQKGVTPHLVIILIGDDPASKSYVSQKEKKAEEIGAKTTVINLPTNVRQAQLLSTIQQYNNNKNVHGIIVQRPLPVHIDTATIDQAVDPAKDVDGFHPQTKFVMPLAAAVLKILETIHKAKAYDVADFREWLASKNIVVIGKGKTGGAPVISALAKLGVQPLIIDSKTKNPKEVAKKADILISAVGKSQMVNGDWLGKDVILISIGMHRGEDGKMHGDYEEDEVKDVATFYTPTPGGVGPVNVAMLLSNVIKAAEHFAS